MSLGSRQIKVYANTLLNEIQNEPHPELLQSGLVLVVVENGVEAEGKLEHVRAVIFDFMINAVQW